jgi:hypothetical protein
MSDNAQRSASRRQARTPTASAAALRPTLGLNVHAIRAVHAGARPRRMEVPTTSLSDTAPLGSMNRLTVTYRDAAFFFLAPAFVFRPFLR